MSGPAVSLSNITSSFTVATQTGGSTSPLTYFNNSTLLAATSGPTLTTAATTTFVTFAFKALVTFSGTGTFNMQAYTSVGADTFTIQAGSTMDVMPVG